VNAIDTLWSKCVLLETGPRCFLCGELADEAHHIYPPTRFPDRQYDADFGVATCSICHPTLHRVPADIVLHHLEGRFPERLARVRDKIAHRPPRTDVTEQCLLLLARMHNAE